MKRRSPIWVLKDHYASLSDADETLIELLISDRSMGDEPLDVADLAVRHCQCGQVIDGFYEYTDHLVKMLIGAGYEL